MHHHHHLAITIIIIVIIIITITVITIIRTPASTCTTELVSRVHNRVGFRVHNRDIIQWRMQKNTRSSCDSNARTHSSGRPRKG
jgi:hypothetical protein